MQYDRELIDALKEVEHMVYELEFYSVHNILLHNDREVSDTVNTLMTYVGDSINGYTPLVFLLDDQNMANTVRNMRAYARHEENPGDPAFYYADMLDYFAYQVYGSGCSFFSGENYIDRGDLYMLAGWAEETAATLRAYARNTQGDWRENI